MAREDKLSAEVEMRGRTGAGPPGRHAGSEANRPRAPQARSEPFYEDADAEARPRRSRTATRRRDGPDDEPDVAMVDDLDGTEPEAPRTSRRQNRLARERARQKEETSVAWWQFLAKTLLLAAILIAVFRFVLGIEIQHGNHMYPFLMDGDLLITYKLDEIQVGDVVAYIRPDTGKTAVSRVAAKGPCEISFADGGGLMVNGAIQDETVRGSSSPIADSSVTYPYSLSAQGYFLLDDNRSAGSDSRLYGEVSQWELIGKVVYVFRRRGI